MSEQTITLADRPVQRRLNLSPVILADFCQRNHIRLLSLFGSVLRNDFGSHSDIDVLVDFEAGHTPGLALIRMQDELSVLFGNRKVDLVTLKFLHPRIREQVLADMEVQYAR
ncbi:MAG: nucleotidyltransferase family protein [Chloroflexi bacterium]|nr:nucleotidyltransferase family protein [Chloroflexota bacterium]